MNLFTVLFLILITLKLLGLIAISWWWVFSPLIILFVCAFLINLGKELEKRIL